MTKAKWEQCSSRFDKNPERFEAEIYVPIEKSGIADVRITFWVKRNGSRWSFEFGDDILLFALMSGREELGEMSGREATSAASQLLAEGIAKIIVELEQLDRLKGYVFPQYHKEIGWQDWTSTSSYTPARSFAAELPVFGLGLRANMDKSGEWSRSSLLVESTDAIEIGKFSSSEEALKAAASEALSEMKVFLAKIKELLE